MNVDKHPTKVDSGFHIAENPDFNPQTDFGVFKTEGNRLYLVDMSVFGINLERHLMGN